MDNCNEFFRSIANYMHCVSVELFLHSRVLLSFLQTDRRDLKLADAAQTCIKSILPDGSWVGLVDFDTVGRILSPLTEVTSTAVRRSLANLVPIDANGGTCIGCGLHTALEVSDMISFND